MAYNQIQESQGAVKRAMGLTLLSITGLVASSASVAQAICPPEYHQAFERSVYVFLTGAFAFGLNGIRYASKLSRLTQSENEVSLPFGLKKADARRNS